MMEKDDFEHKRKLMVDYQLRMRGIRDERVLKAMEEIPRHLFVDESMLDRAYDDCALPIGEGQTISQPYMVALMTELLELKGDEKVLEVGTGSGYQAAILSKLAKEVITIERIENLAKMAKERLKSLGITNVRVLLGNGSIGYKEEAPYDAIIVTASSPSIPEPLIEQLCMGGRLVIPVGDRFSQLLYKVVKTPEGTITTTSTPCVFVPLIGECGWKEKEVE
ncbi:MAG: protein-L-isoaspartate(D-aspartate) O-methyltransferase [Nitrospirae bacterium]|nr:MAG: protein-L-isoaspartate(D-aspartate) O-methyltransferase [Nitrospirota bacterium]